MALKLINGTWLVGPGGDPTEDDDCCCEQCETCCDPGSLPPQLELDASSLSSALNTFLGCDEDCALFADVFMLDLHNTGSTETPGDVPTGTCLWRYCGDPIDCTDGGATSYWGWDVYIRSTGSACEAVAVPWIGGSGCDDFNRAPTGSTAVWRANLPTDPDDCCDALSSPLTLPGVVVGSADILNSDPGAGGCQVFNQNTTSITIEAVGC